MADVRSGQRVVLVVDDEPQVAETYALMLGPEYETRVVTGGQEALEAMDDDVDAVVLDRRMPGLTGDEVLAELRERGYDCTVVMTTAADPDLNILEMDFDDYLCKPIVAETLQETLAQHLDEPSRDPRIDEFFSLVAKLDVLEADKTPSELSQDPEYERIRERAAELGAELRDDIEGFEELHETYRDIERTN